MIVCDLFLPDTDAVRAHALSRDYTDYPAPDGETYKRVWIGEIPGFQTAIERVMGAVDMLGMGYRLNYGGEVPNAAIHSDMGWGTHAAVLYLCHGKGGTAMWRHKATGAERIDAGDVGLLSQIQGDWDDASKWDRLETARLRYGRCVIYESALFHSRWPFEAFGSGPEDGRLIGVAFFTPKESS